eukprot:CAMPEP_0178748032 /NCGR_PEP_ID=MMETSP0744-20121128/8663_1 /TAXON_ID=913974 /ORGANISM="Nitzschia punctata, Strain CCMP561" /LENGTH=457 /DNA_ID=CAMNT_0020401357 /DNA_START=13 /DNA_END=1386 /DNA_ORIENTATION=+
MMRTFDKVDVEVRDEAVIDEMTRGMMFAELAITDNKEKTLEKVAKNNPWHAKALKLITGSDERAHLPLKDILYDDMGGLILDCEMDVSGVTKGGHFLDTQGYIAHNNEYVVVAFRCTTSIFDWMTNFNTTSSAWEVDQDKVEGYSGMCSGFEGLCCQGTEYKPRVHTGFYNNFLAILPDLERHVDQYLRNYERPRKLYIVGHSLGAGIANITATYFLMKYNWSLIPQELVLVTAGSPRSICSSMKTLTDQKREEFGPKQVRFYRIVKGSDIVASVPPKLLGFEHIVEPIVITDEGRIVLSLNRNDNETNVAQLLQLKQNMVPGCFSCSSKAPLDYDTQSETDDDEDASQIDKKPVDDEETKYNKFVARIPKNLRDHMPDFYLQPLFKAKGITCGSLRPREEPSDDDDESANSPDNGSAQNTHRPQTVKQKKQRTWIPKSLWRRKRRHVEVTPAYSYF